MKTVKLSQILFITSFLFILITCNDREVTNPFDANCPKELFTPSDFKAEQEGTTIKLSWKQTNTQISGSVISRNENDGAMTEGTRIDKTVTSWNDPNVKGGIKYGYRLAAYAGDNQSNTVTAFFTPVYGATVSTDAVSGITSTTVVLGGNVTDEGGASVTERGVCYGTTLNPTTADKKAEMGKGQGSFSLTISGLNSGNTYYVRAYAINSQGTTYGTQVTFTTGFLSATPNSYNAPKESGSKEFTVVSNIDWQVSSNQMWCTLSANSGKGNGSITATFTENKEVPQRSATITFTGTGVASQTATLTQSGIEPPILTITPANQNVTNPAGTTTFNITGNVSWTAQSDQTWCTITNTSGVGNATLTINYEANTTNSQRIANLAITGLGLEAKTVTITQQSAIPTDGLVAYYPFNGNANDESGNGNNGTIYGASLTADRKGTLNSSYSFNGNSKIEIADNPILNLSGSKSISLWFYLPASALQNYPTLIYKYGNTYYPTYSLSLSEINIYGSNRYKIDFFFGKNTTNHQVFSSHKYTDYITQWIHIVASYDQISGVQKIYFNGVLSNINSAGNISSNVSNHSLFVGFGDGSSTYFQGIIDDIRIYNRALTETEIKQLYNE
jgi:hypothetical protein